MVIRGNVTSLFLRIAFSFVEFFLFLLLSSLACTQFEVLAASDVERSPEAIFRQTVEEFQTGARTSNWKPWHDFRIKLWDKFSEPSSSSSYRLEVVGAFEEGILFIERAIFQQGQGVNPIRDKALADLYVGYSQTLMALEATECQSLALDPHTLLIGAETVKRTDEPSVHLCVENAENSLRNAASLDATNAQVEELLAELTGNEDTIHKRKPKEFVAELFDSFADTFDEKLLNTLEYKVPGLVGGLAAKLLSSKDDQQSYRKVLDAGCGTGLAGRYLRPFMDTASGILVGVDASQKMLDKAAKCTLTKGCGLKDEVTSSDDASSTPLYEGLVQMDLEEMTVSSLMSAAGVTGLEDGFDLIVAADVLVYFGNLTDLLQTFARVANPSMTRLIFSCELATAEEAPLGWRLLASGRFAHTRDHAVTAAQQAGFGLVHYEEIVPRMEKGEPVRGHLFAFELTSASNRATRDEF